MYKLVLPSALELLAAQTADGITNVTDMHAAEHIISCSLNHIWFYVLDEKLDSVPNPAARFLASIESHMQLDPEDIDPRIVSFISNYDKISFVISKVAKLMSNNLDYILTRDPLLYSYSNAFSYLDVIDNRYLILSFFYTAAERDEYVRRKVHA